MPHNNSPILVCFIPMLSRHTLLHLLHPRAGGGTYYGASSSGSSLVFVPLTRVLLLLQVDSQAKISHLQPKQLLTRTAHLFPCEAGLIVGEDAGIARRFRALQASWAQISFPQISISALGLGTQPGQYLQHGIQVPYPCLAVGSCGWAHN